MNRDVAAGGVYGVGFLPVVFYFNRVLTKKNARKKYYPKARR